MNKNEHGYLVKLEYLGFRYSGWQQQPKHKTIEGMLLKTLQCIIPERNFKILGAGRTDAKVSALDAAFELFIAEKPITNLNNFKDDFNLNLPPDIRIKNITRVKDGFNIIQQAKNKEYVYLFSYGEKNHPFCAPFLANIHEELNIDLMKDAAQRFVGTHDFSLYTAKLQPNTKVVRTINSSKIVANTYISASFFPKKSFAFVVTGKGFIRYQVRMMMGTLIKIGLGELSMTDFERTLLTDSELELHYAAPGSGLLLHKLDFS
ncbi:MAG: tRNA pseudouridine(38-40) synthase TruA [Flavobacteriaceae bacterium]